MAADAAADWPTGIRRAGPGDLAVIEAIEADAFEPSRRSSRRVLRHALRSDFQRVLVLDIGGAVAGFLVLWPYPQTWRIYNLATARAWRGRGVAGRLIAAVREAARLSGTRRVVLEARDEAGLIDFYEAHGFQAVRPLPDYYSDGEHAFRMALDVS